MAEPLWKRNNNPGNIRNSNAKGFRVFGSMDEGMQEWKALMNRRYFGRGLNTPQSIIHTYAPPIENETSKYVDFVSKQMGITPTTVLDPNNIDQMASLASAMFKMETGHTWTPEEIKKAWGSTVPKTPVTQSSPVTTAVAPGSAYYPGSMPTYLGNGYTPARMFNPSNDGIMAWGLGQLAQYNPYLKPFISMFG